MRRCVRVRALVVCLESSHPHTYPHPYMHAHPCCRYTSIVCTHACMLRGPACGHRPAGRRRRNPPPPQRLVWARGAAGGRGLNNKKTYNNANNVYSTNNNDNNEQIIIRSSFNLSGLRVRPAGRDERSGARKARGRQRPCAGL